VDNNSQQPPSTLSERVKHLVDPDMNNNNNSNNNTNNSNNNNNLSNPNNNNNNQNMLANPSNPNSSQLSGTGIFPTPKIETVPTAFKWIHGGNEVFVTGNPMIHTIHRFYCLLAVSLY
jgi:hypothetical protein